MKGRHSASSIARTLVGFLAACGSGLEPGPHGTEVRPTVASLAFTNAAPTAELALELAVTLEAGQAVADNEYLTVSVTTSSGDTEMVYVRPRVCSTPELGEFLCDGLLVHLQPSIAVPDMQPVMERIRAQPVLTFAWEPSESVPVRSEWVSLRLFEFPLDSALAILASMEEVASVDRVYLLRLAGNEEPVLGASIGTASWLGDRRLRAMPEDTVVARYRQPNGSEIAARVEIQ